SRRQRCCSSHAGTALATGRMNLRPPRRSALVCAYWPMRWRGSVAQNNYQTNFRPNCNWRPTLWQLPNLPKPALPTVSAALVGLDRLNVGVFDRLKDSARNSTRLFSPKWKSLKIEKSRLRWPGPRNTMRAEFPNVGVGAPL